MSWPIVILILGLVGEVGTAFVILLVAASREGRKL